MLSAQSLILAIESDYSLKLSTPVYGQQNSMTQLQTPIPKPEGIDTIKDKQK